MKPFVSGEWVYVTELMYIRDRSLIIPKIRIRLVRIVDVITPEYVYVAHHRRVPWTYLHVCFLFRSRSEAMIYAQLRLSKIRSYC